MQAEGTSNMIGELSGCSMHLKARTHRPLDVVSVGARRTKYAGYSIAGMVEDMSAIRDDDAIDSPIETREHGLHLLGIHLRAQARVSRDVGKQHSSLTPVPGVESRPG
jgi:hypothetical protein